MARLRRKKGIENNLNREEETYYAFPCFGFVENINIVMNIVLSALSVMTGHISGIIYSPLWCYWGAGMVLHDFFAHGKKLKFITKD